MKNLFLLLFACFTLSMPVSAQTDDVNSDNDEEIYEEVALVVSLDYDTSYTHGPRRTPPRIPSVYFSRSANRLLFAEPMGECVIELIDMETEDVIFSFPVIYGTTEVHTKSNT